jgi:hypothetical protein
MVTTRDQSSVDQVGLLRTPDGVLHVAWSRATGPNTEDLLHTTITRTGYTPAARRLRAR